MNRPHSAADDETAVAIPPAAPVARRELSGRLAGLTIGQQVFVLAVWPFAEQVLNFMVTFVDQVMAGHLGPARSVFATDALAVGGYVEWLISLIQAGVGVGATAIISRAIGGRHRRIATRAMGQAITMGFIGGLAMGGLVFALAPSIAGFAKLSGPSLDYCVQYLRIVALAAPFSAIMLVGAASLRGAGDTRTPFFVLIVVNLVNASLTYAFVRAPAPLGGHEVAGIATGTLVAYAVGCAMMLTVLLGGWGGLRLFPPRLRPQWHMTKRLIAIGLPSMAERFFGMWIANFLILRIVGTINQSGALGAHMIAIRSEAVSYLPGYAIGIAAATLCGQYLGAGDPDRARKAVIACWRFTAVVMGAIGVFFIVAPWVLVRLATNDPTLLEAAPPLLRITGFVQVFFGTAIVLGQALSGAGDTRATMLLTAGSTYLVRLPLVYTFAIVMKLGLPGVWYGLCCELVFRGCIFAGRFLHGGWRHKMV